LLERTPTVPKLRLVALTVQLERIVAVAVNVVVELPCPVNGQAVLVLFW
jgi:hypothetical protein